MDGLSKICITIHMLHLNTILVEYHIVCVKIIATAKNQTHVLSKPISQLLAWYSQKIVNLTTIKVYFNESKECGKNVFILKTVVKSGCKIAMVVSSIW